MKEIILTELDDISIKQINYILEYYDGNILVEVDGVDVSERIQMRM
jgi:hypothetical protein